MALELLLPRERRKLNMAVLCRIDPLIEQGTGIKCSWCVDEVRRSVMYSAAPVVACSG